MLAQAVKSIGLEWSPPLCPKDSRLDDDDDDDVFSAPGIPPVAQRG